jgi:hypothetical protein
MTFLVMRFLATIVADFAHQLNIKLNQHGLIDKYDQAIQGSDYANRPDLGAELVLWIPWAIIELAIAKQS